MVVGGWKERKLNKERIKFEIIEEQASQRYWSDLARRYLFAAIAVPYGYSYWKREYDERIELARHCQRQAHLASASALRLQYAL